MGRWFAVDPLNEVYYSKSPYNYTLNNPIKYIDPNGTLVYDWDSGEYKDDDGNTISHNDAMEQITNGSKEDSDFDNYIQKSLILCRLGNDNESCHFLNMAIKLGAKKIPIELINLCSY